MLLLANILAAVAEIMGLYANSHQLLHVIKRKTTKGVYGWAWTLSVGGNMAWTVYGVQHKIIALVVANAFLVGIGLLMLSRLYRDEGQRNKMILYACGVGLGLSCMFVYSRELSGWLALIFGTLARLPQLYRAEKDKNLQGLSFTAQVLFFVENTLTFIYSLLLMAWPLLIAASIGVVSSGYIVLKVAKKGRNDYYKHKK